MVMTEPTTTDSLDLTELRRQAGMDVAVVDGYRILPTEWYHRVLALDERLRVAEQERDTYRDLLDHLNQYMKAPALHLAVEKAVEIQERLHQAEAERGALRMNSGGWTFYAKREHDLVAELRQLRELVHALTASNERLLQTGVEQMNENRALRVQVEKLQLKLEVFEAAAKDDFDEIKELREQVERLTTQLRAHGIEANA
jgi:excinuclease UvrABC helicase subunit UvrB